MEMFHELRQKPSHIKSRYAFLGATLITLGIGVIWITTLPARFANIGESVKTTSQNANVGGGFTDLVEEARKGMDTLNAETVTEEGVYGEGNVVEETGGTYPQTPPATGALSNLNGWEANATVTPPTEPTLVRGEMNGAGTARGEAAAGTSSVSFAEPVMTPPPPTPTVILIGTTTSKKSE